jgi:thiol-disulfide isomerase/thioredoxin
MERGIDRRTMLAAGAATLALSGAALADQPRPGMFAGTTLAGNRLARSFSAVDLAFPQVTVIGARGKQSLGGLTGKTLIVSLWAEWCAPCLLEARDFAALRARFADDRFDILAILTASMERLDLAGAQEKLRRDNAPGLPLLIEPDGGDRILRALSPGPGGRGGSLPCTLLADPAGRIRGIAHGAPMAGPPMPLPSGGGRVVVGKALTAADKQAMLANGSRTLWASPDGEEFLKALRDGIALR